MRLRAVASLAALALCADPLARVAHVLDTDQRHTWCHNHQHMVHVEAGDGDHEAHGHGHGHGHDGPNLRGGAASEHEAHACSAFTALRASSCNRCVVVSPPPAEDGEPLRVQERGVGRDVLALAPKHGPPSRLGAAARIS